MKGSTNQFPHLTFIEQASKPSTPAAGNRVLYFKTDNKLYHEDEAGAETEVGAGAAATFVGARYTTNAAATLNPAPSRVDFEDVDYDSGSLVTTGVGWVFTAPDTGYYHVSTLLTFASADWTADDNITIYAYKNGSASQCIGRITGISGTTLASCVGTGIIALTASDTLAIFASQSSATTNLGMYNDGQFNWVAIEKV